MCLTPRLSKLDVFGVRERTFDLARIGALGPRPDHFSLHHYELSVPCKVRAFPRQWLIHLFTRKSMSSTDFYSFMSLIPSSASNPKM